MLDTKRPKDEPRAYTIDEYLNLPRSPQKWIVENFIPYGGYTNIYAQAKIGKSFLMLGIAWAICKGDDNWQGLPIKSWGNVLYLQVDTPREEWAGRLLRMQEDLKDRKYEFNVIDMWTVPSYPFDILKDKNDISYIDKEGRPLHDAEWFAREIARTDPMLIVVDTITEVHNEDENTSKGMKKVLSELRAVAGPNRAIVIISHSRKENQHTANNETDIMANNRGSNYVPGKMDMIIHMTKKEIHYKGRATGYKKLKYYQTVKDSPEDDGGFIHLINDDAKIISYNEMIETLVNKNPGISQTKLADKLAVMAKVSPSTATREIREWKARQQAQQEQANPQSSQPASQSESENLLLDGQDLINPETGEVIEVVKEVVH